MSAADGIEVKIPDVEFDVGDESYVSEVWVTTRDIVESVSNNDESLLAIIVDILDRAGSSELTSRLLERLAGSPCAAHSDQVHGKEAEELRAGIERIIDGIDVERCEDLAEVHQKLTDLLEDVDARDSLAHLERKTEGTDESDR